MSKHGGPFDVMRYGAQGAAVRASVSQKQWNKIVALAHKRGHTVAGELSGNPDPLKERTKSSLMTQAQKLVGQSYDPALKQLDAQGTQLQALSDKRKADNAAYQQWLFAKQSEYNAQAAASQQQYQGYLDNLKATTEQAHQQAQAGAIAAVQGQPGTVSNLQQSTALQGLSADTAKATGLVDNARQQTAAMLPSLQMRSDARQQATIGQGQADEAKRINDLNTGLTQLGDQKFKLLAAKASDVFKTYTDSLNQQVDIANSNRSYQAAADQLGLKQDTLNFNIKKANRDFGLKNRALSEKQANDAAKIKIGYDKIKSQQGIDAANRALKKQLAKQKATPKNGKSTFTPLQASKAYQAVNTVSGLYSDLHSKHPSGILKNGQNFRQYLRSKGFSDTQIDVASDLYAHGGKLSAFGRKQALALGIDHPYNQFGKADVGTPYQGPN